MNRITQHIIDEIWEDVPIIEHVEVSARGTVAQYRWCKAPLCEECTSFWSRTLHKSGATYLRRGEIKR